MLLRRLASAPKKVLLRPQAGTARGLQSFTGAVAAGKGNAKVGRDIESMRRMLEEKRLSSLKQKEAAGLTKHADPLVAQAYRELAEEDEQRRLAGIKGDRKSKAFFGGRRQKKLAEAEKFERIQAAVKGRGRNKVNALNTPRIFDEDDEFSALARSSRYADGDDDFEFIPPRF